MLQRIKNYFSGTQLEMRRVVWPSRADTIRFTLAVILVSLGVAVYSGFLDLLFTGLLERFIL